MDRSTYVALVMIAVSLCSWLFAATFLFCSELHIPDLSQVFDAILIACVSSPTVTLASSRVCARMRRAYLAAVIAQDTEYFETIGAGEVSKNLVRDFGQVQGGIGERFGYLCWSSSSFVVGSESVP